MDIAIDVNGHLGDGENASVSVLDRGFLFGEGVYETLRTYNRRPFLLDRHLARLRASAERIALQPPLDDAAFTARILAAMQAVDAPGERSIRLLLTRGAGELSYDLANCPAPTVVVIVRPHRETPPDVAARGIGIVRSSVMRNHPPAALDPRIKSNNLLNNALAMQEALQAGAAEALMCNHRGELAECAQSNVFLVRGGAALTPARRRRHPGGRHAQLRLRGRRIGRHSGTGGDTAARRSRHGQRAVRDEHHPRGARGHPRRWGARRRRPPGAGDADARGGVPAVGAAPLHDGGMTR